MALTTGPLRKRGPATNCQPSRQSQSAASEPQPQGRGHLDVPGLRGNPHGLCYLEAMALHAEKGNPPARQTGGALAQGGSPDHAGEGRPKHFTDWLISVATNHLSGGVQRGAVQTTGLPAPDPRRQQRRWRRQRRRQLGKLEASKQARQRRPQRGQRTWGAAATQVGGTGDTHGRGPTAGGHGPGPTVLAVLDDE
ncbi:hypothetical protein MTO96_049264 [Rhipicephalus appendiculatus]